MLLEEKILDLLKVRYIKMNYINEVYIHTYTYYWNTGCTKYSFKVFKSDQTTLKMTRVSF